MANHGAGKADHQAVEVDRAGRPILDGAYRRLLLDLRAANLDTLGSLDPSRILIVAGAARCEARASIRPLGCPASKSPPAAGTRHPPRVFIDGQSIAYEICLRPHYFLTTSGTARAGIILHELWHAGPTFDGGLNPDRRHRVTSRDHVETEIRRMLERWRTSASRELTAVLSWKGEVRMRSWLCRPPTLISHDRVLRADYDERDLFLATLEQR